MQVTPLRPAGAALQMVTIRSCPRSKSLPCRLPAIACLELAGPFDNGHTLLLLYLGNVSGLRAHPL